MRVVFNGETLGTVRGTAWIIDSEGDYWAEGEAGQIQVARVDADEVRIGFHLGANENEDAGLYLSLHDAGRLALLLGAAIHAKGDES